MQTIIKASAAIRQNYNEISNLCKDTGEPVFLTKTVKEIWLLWISTHMTKEKNN